MWKLKYLKILFVGTKVLKTSKVYNYIQIILIKFTDYRIHNNKNIGT